MEQLPQPKTEEEIRIEKVLDQMDLARLEDARQVYDMEGYSDLSGDGKRRSRKQKDRLTYGEE